MKTIFKRIFSVIWESVVLCLSVLAIGLFLGLGVATGINERLDLARLLDGRAIVITTVETE